MEIKDRVRLEREAYKLTQVDLVDAYINLQDAYEQLENKLEKLKDIIKEKFNDIIFELDN